MKKILLSFLLLSTILFCNAQDCKLLINSKDGFTGQLLKTSKTLVYKRGTYNEDFIQFERIDDSLVLTFVYNNSTMSGTNSAWYSCQTGSKLYIKWEDSSVSVLNLLGNLYTTTTENADVGTEILLGAYAGLSKKNKKVFQPKYQVNPELNEKLKTLKVAKIRVEATGKAGYTNQDANNIDIILTEEFAKQLLKDINCVLQ